MHNQATCAAFLAAIARSARHPIQTARTAARAGKLLLPAWRAVPWYVWPVLGVAAVVKCFPLDMGTDEALTALALGLIAWRRGGRADTSRGPRRYCLVTALWREAQTGKPAYCQCAPCAARWQARQARRARVRRALRPGA